MVRFEITTRDRLGITVEILEKIYVKGINLVSMEVFLHRVCVKLQDMDDDTKDELKSELLKINDILYINEMELLYHEKTEKALHAVIDSVNEGIISFDKNFKVNIFNNYCENLFNIKKSNIINQDIRTILGCNSHLCSLIENGEDQNNQSYETIISGNKVNYISTGKCIKNDYNDTVAAVISLKDVNEARKLLEVITPEEENSFKYIIGNSPILNKVKTLALTVSKSSSTVILRGESGTGKELFAKAIHDNSDRKDMPFVTINCAALPEALIESELFGYEKGSFTGAQTKGKDGLFKEANKGTLFLDEIGELSLPLQAKLLRVLQNGYIRKIGSTKEEYVDVRIIAATNRNLEAMLSLGNFREDLYYRLNVIPIYIPRLKDRLEDIPLLVQNFIKKLNPKLKRNIKGAQWDFINGLMLYSWPGNIRELENVIERAMIICQNDYLNITDLIIDTNEITNSCEAKKLDTPIVTFTSLQCEIEKTEKEILSQVLENCKSYREAGKILKVSHTTIMNKVKKYNIHM